MLLLVLNRGTPRLIQLPKKHLVLLRWCLENHSLIAETTRPIVALHSRR